MSDNRILLVDDHEILRDGVRLLLAQDGDFHIVKEVATGKEALRALSEMGKEIDIVILDLYLPDLHGADLAREIIKTNDSIKILVLSAHSSPDDIIKLKDLGISGFVLKKSGIKVLLAALHAVKANQIFFDPQMSDLLIASMECSKNNNGWISLLTNREIEILRLIADGKNNDDISKILFLSQKTVKNHITNIFRKMKIRDRTQAAIMAWKEGFIKDQIINR